MHDARHLWQRRRLEPAVVGALCLPIVTRGRRDSGRANRPGSALCPGPNRPGGQPTTGNPAGRDHQAPGFAVREESDLSAVKVGGAQTAWPRQIPIASRKFGRCVRQEMAEATCWARIARRAESV